MNPENKGNKPSPASMLLCLLLNNRESLSANAIPSEISWSDRSYHGFLRRNIAEDTRNTDFLRARASTTQLQGDDWLDCECAATYLQSKIKADNKLTKKPQINLTRTSSFSQKASMTFSNHCRFYCVKKLLVQKKKKRKTEKLLKTDNKSIIERKWTTEHQWLKDVSYVKNTLYEHGCLGCQKYFQNALMKLKSYQ